MYVNPARGFDNNSTPRFDAEAAELARSRTVGISDERRSRILQLKGREAR